MVPYGVSGVMVLYVCSWCYGALCVFLVLLCFMCVSYGALWCFWHYDALCVFLPS